MIEHFQNSYGSRSIIYFDAARLRSLVYDLRLRHERLKPTLLRLAAAGRALAAEPGETASREAAREAWRELLELTDQNATQAQDEELLENAKGLRLLPDIVAHGMLEVCNRLKELEYQISQIDFDQSPAELLQRSGEAMRNFAATLDALSLREDQEVLPRLQQLLYQHGVAPKR